VKAPPARRRPGLRVRARRLYDFARRDIWLLETETLPRLWARLTRIARILLLGGRGFWRDRAPQQAAALTYRTIFSLPPVLAFAFAAAKGLNLYGVLKASTVEPFLDATFGPRGVERTSQLREAVDQIFQYVERTDLRALGTFALLFMLYSVVGLLGSVEGTLNGIWGVRRSRTLMRRVSDYLAIVVVAPIFLFTAAGLTTFLQGREIPLAVGGASIKLLPLLAVWFGLGFVYLTLPNTRVRPASAILGGLVGGTIWQAIQVLHVTGQLQLARYNTIYSSFAAVPMLLLWIYLSWSVFLIGAELAFAHQNESLFTSLQRTGKIDQAFREGVAPRLAARIAAAFLAGHPAPTVTSLSGELGLAPRLVSEVLTVLVDAELLARAQTEDEDGFLPARDPDTITVLDLLTAMRRESGAGRPPIASRLDERIDRVLDALETEGRRSLSNHTLRELAAAQAGPESESADAAGATATSRPAENPS
jgi:membrane protein